MIGWVIGCFYSVADYPSLDFVSVIGFVMRFASGIVPCGSARILSRLFEFRHTAHIIVLNSMSRHRFILFLEWSYWASSALSAAARWQHCEPGDSSPG